MSQDIQTQLQFYHRWKWEYTVRNPAYRAIWAHIDEYLLFFQREGIIASGEGRADFDLKRIHFNKDATCEHDRRINFTEKEKIIYDDMNFYMESVDSEFGYTHIPLGTKPCLEPSECIDIICSGEDLPYLGIEICEENYSDGAIKLLDRFTFSDSLNLGIEYQENFHKGYHWVAAINLDSPEKELIESIKLLKRDHDFFSAKSTPDVEYWKQIDERHRLMHLLRIKARDGVSFDADDRPRLLGLWLWEYVEGHGCSQIEAIRQLKNRFNLDTLGCGASESRTFRNMHNRTKECIRRCEVLSLKG